MAILYYAQHFFTTMGLLLRRKLLAIKELFLAHRNDGNCEHRNDGDQAHRNDGNRAHRNDGTANAMTY
ncbi:MAG: hypothetical protein ABIN04_14005 [Ginsengibacter sp.]